MLSTLTTTRPTFDDLAGVVCVAGQPLGFTGEPFAEEAALVEASVPERRALFTAGRAAAHLVLSELGAMPAPLLRAPSGAPQWPAGVVGSLSHCDGQVAAAVASRSRWTALGIDVEPNARLPADAEVVVLNARDRLMLDTLPGGLQAAQTIHWPRLLFCAKECVHKCLNPLRGAWLEFEEVAIEIDAERGCFTPRPVSPVAVGAFAGLGFKGRWQCRDGFLLAILASA